MNNVWIPNVFPAVWYDNSSITPDESGYIQFQNKVNL